MSTSAAPTTPTTTTMGPQHQQPECDYDTNPTVLYQAIEMKQWDYAASLFLKEDIEGQSGTWVVRKETNGKLRWRLLPLHAAIIFGSPVELVECLLADNPAAAQCKDDQGMLPLHLAFRNEGSASWEIIDELLTAYPQAIFVKDRKGRTPLQCGIQLTSGSLSSSMSVSSAPQQSKTFKSVVSVLDLYAQIVVSGERQRAQQDARKQVEARITQIQETHLQTLTKRKQEWGTQQEESEDRMVVMKDAQEALVEQIKEQDMTIENLQRTEVDLQRKLEDMSMKMHQQGKNDDNKPLEALSSASSGNVTNELLRSVVHDLVAQQREYHSQFSALVGKYEQLAEERKRILEVFTRETDNQDSREGQIVENLKQWLHTKDQKLQKIGLGGGGNNDDDDDDESSVENDEKKSESPHRGFVE
jgi:hypothetical protein